MPPKVKYSREDVIKAALEVVEECGLRELTARRVAAKLGSSTAPVYKHFVTMDELALAVIRETQKMLLDYTSRPYTERVFLNMGTGTAMFACEHGQLYRALLLEGDSYGDVVHEILEILESELITDTRFTMLSAAERRGLLQKMWTFTHGLASLICVGLIKDCSQECIIKTLLDVGGDVIGATLAKHDSQAKDRRK
ncbi:MAG: TetR/AcrR family transcriptional regulator [Candidatus Zixiibacteriota bacterium]|nr:MAG: TetR/AcrR family transcriptional regulator [candidate division Zixibacteria bacterium]